MWTSSRCPPPARPDRSITKSESFAPPARNVWSKTCYHFWGYRCEPGWSAHDTLWQEAMTAAWPRAARAHSARPRGTVCMRPSGRPLIVSDADRESLFRPGAAKPSFSANCPMGTPVEAMPWDCRLVWRCPWLRWFCLRPQRPGSSSIATFW